MIRDLFLLLVPVGVPYVLIGNVLVVNMLRRNGIAVSLFLSGTPGYVYSLCKENEDKVGVGWRRFALSQIYVFLLVVALGIAFGYGHK